jgi:hypothetical protein
MRTAYTTASDPRRSAVRVNPPRGITAASVNALTQTRVTTCTSPLYTPCPSHIALKRQTTSVNLPASILSSLHAVSCVASAAKTRLDGALWVHSCIDCVCVHPQLSAYSTQVLDCGLSLEPTQALREVPSIAMPPAAAKELHILSLSLTGWLLRPVCVCVAQGFRAVVPAGSFAAAAAVAPARAAVRAGSTTASTSSDWVKAGLAQARKMCTATPVAEASTMAKVGALLAGWPISTAVFTTCVRPFHPPATRKPRVEGRERGDTVRDGAGSGQQSERRSPTSRVLAHLCV